MNISRGCMRVGVSTALLLLAALGGMTSASESGYLTKIIQTGEGASTRLELVFDNEVWGDVSVQPKLLRLDLVGVKAKRNLKIPRIKNRAVRSIRLGRTADDALSVEFTLNRAVGHDWKEVNGRSRFVIYMGDTTRVQRSDVLIAIDAGHGGRDGGASNKKSKLLEKDVVLKIAKELEKLINKTTGMKSFMVRSKDEGLRLRTRKARAKNAGADFFVSIHADAEPSGRARGGSVFSLSSRGATNVTAQVLAARENKADLVLGEVPPDELDSDLAHVLVDLSVNAMQDRGAIAAQMVLVHLRKVIRIHGAGTGRANFAVLRNHQIPSILVESGFISNNRDVRNLNSWKMRGRIAKAVLHGIEDYFKRYPPADSVFAESSKPPGRYKVKRGDSLSLIASRLGVAVEVLRKANSLKGDIIHPGQNLVVPR